MKRFGEVPARADPRRTDSGVGRIVAWLSAAALLIVALITIDLYWMRQQAGRPAG